jgi:acetyl-CoA C-acetyltransferase
MGPVPASKRTLSRAGWEPKDLDLMEINEAFAAQAIAVNRQMGWDYEQGQRERRRDCARSSDRRVGLSCSGDAAARMQKRDARRGLASLCIGGGMGVALAVER